MPTSLYGSKWRLSSGRKGAVLNKSGSESLNISGWTLGSWRTSITQHPFIAADSQHNVIVYNHITVASGEIQTDWISMCFDQINIIWQSYVASISGETGSPSFILNPAQSDRLRSHNTLTISCLLRSYNAKAGSFSE